MRLILKYIVLVLLAVIGSPILFAQRYPVQVMTQLTPPYSLILSDYAKPASQKLFVTIMVNDLNIVNLPVRLHIKMETRNGMTVETIPNIITPAIYLTGGMVTMLYGTDLRDYFNINNLQFKGYSKEDYRRTGQLPEGHYRITVEVRHWATGRIISSQGTSYTWMALGKPPMLKVPEDKAEMGKIPGMPLTFSWIPNKVGIPGVIPQYKFEMWEMRIPGINPNVIAASLPPFYTTTQLITNLVIHPATLNFEPGLEYAWRVTAFDPIGDVTFEQGGHSVIRTFTYQCKCEGVSDVKLERKGRNVAVSWQQIPNKHTSFHLEMENQASGWMATDVVYNNKANSGILVQGQTYRMRVRAICDGNTMNPSEPTAWQTITIPEPPKRDPDSECGVEPKPIPITNAPLRNDLQPGDMLIDPHDGGSRYIVKTATVQSDGRYKGIFLFWWEWAGELKAVCEYWDLAVNTDNQILNMNYKSVYNPAFLVDVDAAKAKIENVADAVGNLTNAAVDVVNTLTESIKPKNATSVGFTMPENPVADISKPGEVTITDEKGENLQIVELPKNEDGTTNLPAMIQDASGKTFIVDKNGNVAQENNMSTASTTSVDTDSTKSKAHYSIEGHDFYDGETIYLPLSDKTYEIKAYRDSVNLFGERAVWSSGVNKVDAATVRFTPNTVSNDINGTGISTVLGNDALRCKIVVVNVEFEEDPNQQWGFDENDPPKEDLYTSYKNTLPKPGIKWKSVQSDGSYDKLKIKVTPMGAEKSIALKMSNAATSDVRPKTLTSSQQTIEVNNNATNRESSLLAQVGYFTNDTMQVKVIGYALITKSLAIIAVNDIDTIIAPSVSITQIEAALKKRYKYAVVNWDVIPALYNRTTHYDLNNDGALDIRHTETGYNSDEIKMIIDSCKVGGDDLYNLFIVNKSLPSANGVMLLNQRYGFIFASPNMAIPHEIGHGAFGLFHPWSSGEGLNGYPNRSTNDWTAKDTNNLMEWEGSGWQLDKLRKYQWDKMR